MSREKHDQSCPGCQPAVIDPATGQVLPGEHPIMKAVLRVWRRTTVLEREAWHRFTCQNSRLPADVRIAKELGKRIEREARSVRVPNTQE